jgi:hypothetical protein
VADTGSCETRQVDIQPSAKDYESVDAAMRSVGGSSLVDLIGSWEDLVQDVEAGYTATQYEYRDELSARTWLFRAWPLLTPQVQGWHEDKVRDLDERFRRATVPLDTAHDSLPHWWERREPKTHTGNW